MPRLASVTGNMVGVAERLLAGWNANACDDVGDKANTPSILYVVDHTRNYYSINGSYHVFIILVFWYRPLTKLFYRMSSTYK